MTSLKVDMSLNHARLSPCWGKTEAAVCRRTPAPQCPTGLGWWACRPPRRCRSSCQRLWARTHWETRCACKWSARTSSLEERIQSWRDISHATSWLIRIRHWQTSHEPHPRRRRRPRRTWCLACCRPPRDCSWRMYVHSQAVVPPPQKDVWAHVRPCWTSQQQKG